MTCSTIRRVECCILGQNNQHDIQRYPQRYIELSWELVMSNDRPIVFQLRATMKVGDSSLVRSGFE